MLLDLHEVADRKFVLLVMGVVFLGATHRLLHLRVGEAALDPHDDGLGLLVAHHHALQHAPLHRPPPLFPRRRPLGLRGSLDPGDVATDLAHPRRVRELAGRPLETQVELLLLELEQLVVQLVRAHRPQIFGLEHLRPLFGDALDEARSDRQLGGRKVERLAGDLGRHAVDLEQNAARLDPHHPEFRRALAGPHAHFERLLGHRNVRIDADPDPPGPLHMACQGAPRRLDLARRDAVRLHGLEAEMDEAQRRAVGGDALDPALVRLAELGAHRLQHGTTSLSTFKNTSSLSALAARAAGLALGHPIVLRHRVVLEDLALEDPTLDAAGAVGGKRGGDAVVDIGAQRMQRHPAFAIPFHAGDFGAAQPAPAIDADALGAEAHRRLHGALHGAAERDAAFELLGDRFGHQLGVELGLPDLDDVDDDVAVGETGHLLAQLLDVGTLLADHDARPRRVDRHPAFLVRPLDHDLGHRRLLELLAQVLADLHVLVQQLAVLILAGIPTRIPRPVDAETQACRIDLLTHRGAS